VSYAQGFMLLREAAKNTDGAWTLGRSPCWAGGCIIRSAFLDRIKAASIKPRFAQSVAG
jgi:6-phosphogluconate dehydrogenase